MAFLFDMEFKVFGPFWSKKENCLMFVGIGNGEAKLVFYKHSTVNRVSLMTYPVRVYNVAYAPVQLYVLVHYMLLLSSLAV